MPENLYSPMTPKPDQNPLNLRQIDELSESDSMSSGNSTKNSRYLMKGSAQGSRLVDDKISQAQSFGQEVIRTESLQKKSSVHNASLLMALDRNNEEISRL